MVDEHAGDVAEGFGVPGMVNHFVDSFGRRRHHRLGHLTLLGCSRAEYLKLAACSVEIEMSAPCAAVTVASSYNKGYMRLKPGLSSGK